MFRGLVFMALSIFVVGVSAVYSQEDGLCRCWLATIDRNISSTGECKKMEDLTETETLKVMKCFLDQKGNQTPYFGVVLRDEVSQTFAATPVEVASLFYVSYLFRGDKNFADAIVLLYDRDDQHPNSRKAIETAYKAYRKWFKKVEALGLGPARQMKLDPLEKTNISWY